MFNITAIYLTVLLMGVLLGAGGFWAFLANGYLKNQSKAEVKKWLKDAANIAQEAGNFELYDTEGRSGQRLERARIAHAIELEILGLISRC